MGNDRNREVHDDMVRYMATLISKAGYVNMRVQLPESQSRPDRIAPHETGHSYGPDITALREGCLHIFQVETEETITSHDTLQQLKTFAIFADRNNALFTLVVPSGCKRNAEQLLVESGVFARIIEILSP